MTQNTTKTQRGASKSPSKRKIEKKLPIAGDNWIVKYGTLEPVKRKPGRPSAESKIERLFRVVGEKIPYEYISEISADMEAHNLTRQGVYVAHDSMGCPRYIGRGNIFSRLKSHFKAHPLELHYFSFYVVEEKNHEREIETLLIRAASFLLHFNDRKKRLGIAPGNVNDFEPGTLFYQRATNNKSKNTHRQNPTH